ncbi:MAG: hypothetical protein IT369_11080 [Candidatus Latescibacteria bacterium]|nr:hypothetical protein [Candidatus Latescibacterota bacterium]
MSRVAAVNTTDLAGAIRLGCRTMQRVLNADDDHVPFFGSSLRPRAALSFSAHHSESHVPGRHLNALLNAEDAVGLALDERAVEHHRRAALLSYSGPVPLPLNRTHIGGPLVNFCPHNLREGFHALYALARFRDDRRAAELFEQSIAAICRLWRPDAGWDLKGLAALGLQYQECQGFLHGEARMLGPLVKYYRATGHTPALRLALVLAEKALAEFFLPDGEYHPERFITRHSHSITCVLSSLAQLADLLDDAALLGRVRAFCERGLWALRDQLCWSPEAVGQQDTDHGEANNSGDILETALILGRRGYPEYFHDAEVLLRGHLLPSQLRDVSFVEEPANPDGVDGLHQVGDRHLGAFGFPAPYGHESIGKGRGNLSFNMDIVGGAVASLCEAYREVARQAKTGTWVNLLFDHQTPAVRVRSPYTGPGLEIEPLSARPLWVRLPPWAEPAAVQLEGTAQPPVWSQGYLFFAQPVPRQPLRLRFPLPVRELVLSGRVHLHPIRVRLQGDAVVAMDHFGADLTFFDPY